MYGIKTSPEVVLDFDFEPWLTLHAKCEAWYFKQGHNGFFNPLKRDIIVIFPYCLKKKKRQHIYIYVTAQGSLSSPSQIMAVSHGCRQQAPTELENANSHPLLPFLFLLVSPAISLSISLTDLSFSSKTTHSQPWTPAREGPFAARDGRGEPEEAEEVEANPVRRETPPLPVGEAREMVEVAVSGHFWRPFLVPANCFQPHDRKGTLRLGRK